MEAMESKVAEKPVLNAQLQECNDAKTEASTSNSEEMFPTGPDAYSELTVEVLAEERRRGAIFMEWLDVNGCEHMLYFQYIY